MYLEPVPILILIMISRYIFTKTVHTMATMSKQISFKKWQYLELSLITIDIVNISLAPTHWVQSTLQQRTPRAMYHGTISQFSWHITCVAGCIGCSVPRSQMISRCRTSLLQTLGILVFPWVFLCFSMIDEKEKNTDFNLRFLKK